MKSIPIAVKVNLLILVSLAVGIGTIAIYLGLSLSRTIEAETEASLDQEADIVFEAIEQLMMPGEAPLVVNYFEGIGDLNSRLRIYLYRTDGTPAFSDNETIRDVNGRIETRMFLERADASDGLARRIMAPPIADEELFATARALPARSVVSRNVENGRTVVQYFKPVINLPKCTICHGSDHTIRGILDIRSDITASVLQQRNAVVSASGAFLLLVALVGFLMSRFISRQFIAPLREIGATCEAVTAGDFSRRSDVPNRDELGALSRTVNTMVEGLYERFVLTRFVSGSTLRALSGNSESRKEPLTFLFSDVRGFTSFTEKSEPEQVVETLNALLADQTAIITREGGDIDKYVGDEIVAVFTGDDSTRRALSAAQEIVQQVRTDVGDRYQSLTVGVGINHGTAIVGAVGGRDRADFTVIGDNVNVAARLCSAAAGNEILISESAWRRLPEHERPTDGPYRLSVKGKQAALRVYRIKPSAPTQEAPR